MNMQRTEAGQSPEIALAGQVCIDRNDIDGQRYTSWGSAVLYVADYFQRSHGIDPTILTSHGPDFAPFSDGFSLHPADPISERTLVYENTVRNAARIQRCLNANGEVLPPVDKEARDILSASNILFLAPLTPAYHPDHVEELLTSAPEDGLKVLLPQGYLREIAGDGTVSPRQFEEEADIISGFDLLVISEEDIPDAIAVATEWKGRHPKTTIIVTKGPKGASVIEKGMEIPVPTSPVSSKVKADATGCGDTFSAAVAWNLFQDPYDIYSAVERANTATRKKLLLNSAGNPASGL